MKPAGLPGTWRVETAGLRRWRASTPAEAGSSMAHLMVNRNNDKNACPPSAGRIDLADHKPHYGPAF